ncbi:hypothetical protein [Chryseobacterium sp. 18068]|uniref:hypothetical protein n=1 Tax=Chryseobacterium sp. 18068 TaxID=2681414 RepID=UPI00135BC785|nr:hypothetical protein [Chryseobacterium sp. 18068]
MNYTEKNFNEDIQFISSYVNMEKASLAKTKKFMKKILPPRKFEHLYNSWEGRYDKESKVGQFGSFFTNIEHKTQALFLRDWGLVVPNFEEYLNTLESSPIANITTTPPLIIERLHYLLVFFLNHGINEEVNGYSLINLPEERYGNSYNWGYYILSLNKLEQFRLLSHLANYCNEQIKSSSNNREKLKGATIFQH